MNSSGARAISSIRRHPLIVGITAIYVAGWTVYGLATGTNQVFPYLAWMVLAGGLLMFVDSRVRFSTHVLVLLSLAGFFHMAGGNVVIDGVFLYQQSWLEFIRYDHLLHAMGLGTAGLAVWEATYRMLDAPGGKEAAVVVFLGANAVGAFIEIGEYLASLLIPGVRVGDYSNNMQDLIANLLGAVLAAWWAGRRPGRSRSWV